MTDQTELGNTIADLYIQREGILKKLHEVEQERNAALADAAALRAMLRTVLEHYRTPDVETLQDWGPKRFALLIEAWHLAVPPSGGEG